MNRQYVGARYVPKFAEPVEWVEDKSYEALTICTYNNSSYTSKIPVPASVGNPADNQEYWVLTGNYNAQIEGYRQQVEKLTENLGYATPEMYGAKGDGITDDSDFIIECINNNKNILLKNTYLITKQITLIGKNVYGSGTLISTMSTKNLIMIKDTKSTLKDFNIICNLLPSDTEEKFCIQVSSECEINNLKIELNGTNQVSSITGIFVTSPYIPFKNVRIINTTINNNIDSGKKGGCLWVWGSKYDIHNIFINNCTLFGRSVDEIFGFYTQDTSQNIYCNVNNTIIHCDSSSNNNIVSNNASGKQNLTFNNCTFINDNITNNAFKNNQLTYYNNCVFNIKNNNKYNFIFIKGVYSNCIFNDLSTRVRCNGGEYHNCTFNYIEPRLFDVEDVILDSCSIKDFVTNDINVKILNSDIGNISVIGKNHTINILNSSGDISVTSASANTFNVINNIGNIDFNIVRGQKITASNNISSVWNFHDENTPITDDNIGEYITAPRTCNNNFDHSNNQLTFTSH